MQAVIVALSFITLGAVYLMSEKQGYEQMAGAKARGIRNNNPLNIRWDGVTAWDGIIGADGDGFAMFQTPEHGIRAAARILSTYAARGLRTVDQIVSTWAPPVENDTGAYIRHVSSVLNIQPWEVVEPERWPDLLAVMILHENGVQPYSMGTIIDGVSMA